MWSGASNELSLQHIFIVDFCLISRIFQCRWCGWLCRLWIAFPMVAFVRWYCPSSGRRFGDVIGIDCWRQQATSSCSSSAICSRTFSSSAAAVLWIAPIDLLLIHGRAVHSEWRCLAAVVPFLIWNPFMLFPTRCSVDETSYKTVTSSVRVHFLGYWFDNMFILS